MAKPTPSPDLAYASHVRLAYRALLGREATDAEVREQLSGLRTTAELLEIITGSPEFTGQARVVLDPKPGRSRVNHWHPAVAEWTHPPGTLSQDGVAIVGEEGWLFIQGGANSNLAQYTGELQMDEGWAQAWRSLTEHRRGEADRLGMTMLGVVIPDKLALQPDAYPGELTAASARPVERLLDEVGLDLIYPLEQLRASTRNVAMKTDSHLTPWGNYEIHLAIAKALEVEPVSEQLLDGLTGTVGIGDLGAHFDPPIVEVHESLHSFGDAELVEDNYEAVQERGGHIGIRRVFRNATAADQRTVVMFGDSYGFATERYHGLAWFIAQLFGEVHFVWAPFGWDAGYALRAGADVVISQTAERFVARVPATGVDADLLIASATGSQRPFDPEWVFADQA